MSYKGPSLASDPSRSPRPSPLTGKVTQPVDPVFDSDPGGPRHPASATPASKLAEHRTDLRLRPIPLFPEEGREESSMPGGPGTTRVRGHYLSHTWSSGGSSTGDPHLLHRTPALLHR